MFQETLGCVRGPQALDELASEKNARRAPAGAQLSENMRAAPKRERHVALSRAMGTASHSCHEFRKADDKKVHAEKKHVDLALVFDRSAGPSRLELPQTSAWDVRRAPFLARISHRRRQARPC